MRTKQDYDVVDLLLVQHAGIRTLIEQVKNADGDRKRDAFEKLARLVVVHESAEEQVVHPVARRQIGDAVVEARLLEEREIRTLLAELCRQGVGDRQFDRRFATLEAALQNHTEREEQAELPALRRTIEPARLQTMAGAVRVAEAVAPTRPHPQAGGRPVHNPSARPPISLLHRIRNAFDPWRRSRRN